MVFIFYNDLDDKEDKLTFNSGLSRSSNTVTNSGVRSISTGSSNGTISVNKNGTSTDVSVKGLGSNAYTSTKYLPLSGGTITGILTLNSTIEFANNGGCIDWHFNDSTLDYTTRIKAEAMAELTCVGKNTSGTTIGATLKAAAYNQWSSINIKENVEDITDDEAKKILELRPVSFDYKQLGNKNQRGLIAEEVLEVLPNMVTIPEDYVEFDPENPSNVPSIDYSKFVPYLIKMIQIQQKEIEELK